MQPGAERVAELLRAAGVAGEVREFGDSTRTAAHAAAALGCPVGAIANSLVFMADGVPVLIFTSGAHRVDTTLVAGIVVGRSYAGRIPTRCGRRPVSRSAASRRSATPTKLDALIDTALRRFETIWASAGTPHSVFATTFAELARIADATRDRRHDETRTHRNWRSPRCSRR